MDVRIERLVAGGAGLARTPEGVLLVPGTLPGERVRVGAVERRGGVGRARLVEVLEAHPLRLPSDCPHYDPSRADLCGGCALRHAAYDLELEAKRGIVREALERIGRLSAEVAPVLPSPRVEGYRNHVRFHRAGGRLGFRAAGTHDVVDVAACRLARPEIAAAYAALRARGTGAEAVVIRTDGERTLVRESFAGRRTPLPGPLHHPLGGRRFRTSWPSFFQVNLGVAEALAERVLDRAGEGDLLVDAYAGVGVFAVLAAGRFRRRVALEVARSAVEDARANGRGDAGLAVVRHDAARGLPAALGGRPEAVVLDPPRAGLAPRLVRDLLGLRPPRLVYVSCDPATLGRDLAALVAGGYRLAGPVEPLDMFPRTPHVECLAVLER